MNMLALPVDAVLSELTSAVRRAGAAVLQAPTGAGKTTRVPPALLDAGLAASGIIVMLEPRRLAAQTAARRMAAELDEPIGQTIGYHIRFDRRASRATKILVVTEGVLLRMLVDDPLLEHVSVLIFDEFHERSLNSDLALAIARRLKTELRPDLKLVVMSATLETEPIAQFLNCPVVRSEGRLFPVDIRYLPLPARGPLPTTVANGARELLDATTGDLLVFLPGVGEIRRANKELTPVAADRGLEIMELYGDLPMEQQESVLAPSSRRKIILSTNVAETSVTIEGVTGVVDSGFARILRCEEAVGINRLSVDRISRASADQRAGRAGRTAPGVCLRLWTEHEHRFLAERETPEIRRLDLSSAMLLLVAWGETDLDRFPWFEPPRPSAWSQAEQLLIRLQAIENRTLTLTGRTLATLPVHPRLGRLMIEACELGCTEQAAIAAALLSERDPFQREQRNAATYSTDSDLLDRVHALQAFAGQGYLESPVGRLNRSTANHILRIKSQLLRVITEAVPTRHPESNADEPFLRAVVAAFPDRIARRRQRNSRRAVMVGGRGVVLSETSAVHDGQFFACVDLEEVGANEAIVRQASLVHRSWLPTDRVSSVTEVRFDEERQRVVMARMETYDDLVLEEMQIDRGDPDEIAQVLFRAAENRVDEVLPLDEPRVAQFLARVRSLRIWMPELELPEFSVDQLREILRQLCVGCRSFAEIRQAPLLDYLRAGLSSRQLAAIERDAPERIAAASGSMIRLEYEPGRPPVMAVRIQEMFGLRESPRVAGGRIAVLLHLLGPNMRAQQITDDLKSFWERVYPTVRKELRRRYPKHSWPDDPLTAPPEHRPKRKS